MIGHEAARIERAVSMKTQKLTKSDHKFIRKVMEKYADWCDGWPKTPGKITPQQREANHARLIARWKLAEVKPVNLDFPKR